MAIDKHIHSEENMGLRGAWNRTLGQKDLQGNSYLNLFRKEAILTALAMTDKDTKKSDTKDGSKKEKPFSERPYKDTVNNKEFSPISMAAVCALLSVPISFAAGVGSSIIDPTVEFETTVAAPSNEISQEALSFSYQGSNYLLIEDEERYELYSSSPEEENTLQLLSQQEALSLSTEIKNQFQASEIGQFMPSFSYAQGYEDVSVPILDDDGSVIRIYDEITQNHTSINLVEDHQGLTELWTDVQATSLTENYGLSADDYSNLQEDYSFWDGWDAAFEYGMLGGYLLIVLSGAHGTATARVNKNPINRRRKEAQKKR